MLQSTGENENVGRFANEDLDLDLLGRTFLWSECLQVSSVLAGVEVVKSVAKERGEKFSG